VADHENGRRRGLLRVERELVQPLELLRLLEDHHLVLSHHRHLAAEVDHLPRLGVAPVDGDLVEGPRGLVEDRRGQLVRECVDEVALLAHQQVDAGKPAGRDLCRDPFVLGDGILEFQSALCHFKRFLW